MKYMTEEKRSKERGKEGRGCYDAICYERSVREGMQKRDGGDEEERMGLWKWICRKEGEKEKLLCEKREVKRGNV